MLNKELLQLTNEQKEYIILKLSPIIGILDDAENFQKRIDESNFPNFSVNKCVCYCKRHNGSFINGNKCYFSQKQAMKKICTEEIEEIYKNNKKLVDKKLLYNYSCYSFASSDLKSKFNFKNIFFATKHPLEKNSIIIYEIIISVKYSSIFSINNFTFNIKNYVEIIPNKPSLAYSLKNKIQNVFEVLKINSRTCSEESDNNIIFDQSNNALGFINNNIEFSNYIGISNYFNNTNLSISFTALFKFYICMYSSFPCVEQLVKANNFAIVDSAIQELSQVFNRENVNRILNDLNKIINPNATSSKKALILPTYIVDFLKDRTANLDAYISWTTIYSYDKLSKEQFYKIINTDEFLPFVNNMETQDSFKEIIKHKGYTCLSIINYIIKPFLKTSEKLANFLIKRRIDLLADYLTMCDLMDIEFEMFPSQLEATHDSLAKLYKTKQNYAENQYVLKRAELIEKYIPEDEKFTIVIPKNAQDFTTEGLLQHNCVGSYFNKVLKNECFVFFIREKDNPNIPFVTADCTKHGLNQLMYRNNIPCSNEDVKKIAENFCSKIKNLF